MLDAYLNMDYVGNTWFNGLSISAERPDDPLKNSFPVIKLDLKMDIGDYDEFIDHIHLKITDLYTRWQVFQWIEISNIWSFDYNVQII